MGIWRIWMGGIGDHVWKLRKSSAHGWCPPTYVGFVSPHELVRYIDGSKPWYLVNPKIAGKWMFIPLKMVRIHRYWSIAIYLRYSYSQTVEFTWDLVLSPHLRHKRLQWPLDHRTPLLETVQQEIRTDGVEKTLVEMLYYFVLNQNVVERPPNVGKRKNRKPTSQGWFIAAYADFGGCFTGFTTLVLHHLWSLIDLKSWGFKLAV